MMASSGTTSATAPTRASGEIGEAPTSARALARSFSVAAPWAADSSAILAARSFRVPAPSRLRRASARSGSVALGSPRMATWAG